MSLGRNLKRLMESHGVQAAAQQFNDAVTQGMVPRNQISLRDLAENIVGHDWANALQRYQSGRLQESGEAVDASAFADITGQLLINEIQKKYQSPEFIGDQLVETVPITNGNLGTQKTPWLSDVIDKGEVVQPGMPYPHTVFSQQYITYPAPEKWGQICAVTMEMIYSDLTSQAMDSAGSVGRAAGYAREEKILKEVLGITNNFNFLGSAINTYQTSGTYWTNSIADEVLVDWSNVNNLEQLFYKMTDPATGRLIYVNPTTLFTMPQLKYTAKRVVNATETRSGDITTGSGNQVLAVNPLDTNYKVVTSPIAYKLMVDSGVDATKSGTYWHLLDTNRAFVWRQVYGLRTETAPKGNPLEFNQDIALAVKAGWYGIAATRDPRYVARGYDA